MASIKLTGDTSGEITISAPAVAGTNTITLPASSGTMITSDNINNYASSFFSESVTFSTNTTVTSANAGKVYFTSTDNLTLTLPALPGGTDVLAYGVINDSNTDLILSTNTPASEYIGVWLGSALLASKQEALIVSYGSGWKLIGVDANSSINIQQFTASGTYTPEATVSAFLVCLGGAAAGSSPTYGAAGGSYSEKLYSSPSGSYAIVLGAGGALGGNAGGTSTFNGSDISVPSNTAPNPGTPTGGDWNVTGGTGGTTSTGRGGGGAGAGRAGAGGNGANGSGSSAGGGGGTGGNNASGGTGGAAATTQNASAYNLSSLFNTFSFSAGGNATGTAGGGTGAEGKQSITLLDGTTNTLYAGRFGYQASNNGIGGGAAQCTIVEFKG